MRRWEYSHLEFQSEEELQREADKLGKEGWELVSVVVDKCTDSDGSSRYYHTGWFKRELT
jgi:hypothetical protein